MKLYHAFWNIFFENEGRKGRERGKGRERERKGKVAKEREMETAMQAKWCRKARPKWTNSPAFGSWFCRPLTRLTEQPPASCPRASGQKQKRKVYTALPPPGDFHLPPGDPGNTQAFLALSSQPKIHQQIFPQKTIPRNSCHSAVELWGLCYNQTCLQKGSNFLRKQWERLAFWPGLSQELSFHDNLWFLWPLPRVLEHLGSRGFHAQPLGPVLTTKESHRRAAPQEGTIL